MLLLDPLGFPTSDLMHLLTSPDVARSMTPQTILAGPAADEWEANRLAKVPSWIKPVPCFDGRTVPVSTNLLLLYPSTQAKERIFAQLFRRHRRRQGRGEAGDDGAWLDWQAINHEFSCNEEIAVLGQGYSQADYTFIKVAAS